MLVPLFVVCPFVVVLVVVVVVVVDSPVVAAVAVVVSPENDMYELWKVGSHVI